MTFSKLAVPNWFIKRILNDISIGYCNHFILCESQHFLKDDRVFIAKHNRCDESLYAFLPTFWNVVQQTMGHEWIYCANIVLNVICRMLFNDCYALENGEKFSFNFQVLSFSIKDMSLAWSYHSVWQPGILASCP